jgi:hypothetical protein
MYNEIFNFCKVRNSGSISKNDPHNPPPRVNFILELLDKLNISYELDKFPYLSTSGYNIYLKGTSSRMLSAHHDIVNPLIDNANDNSASVINAIMLKSILPEVTVAIVDGEELGGVGSKRCSHLINSGYFGKIDWVLNLELTGSGGENFFIGQYPGVLYNHIKSNFDCITYPTPFNDSVIYRQHGIDSCVINPLPKIGESLDFSLLYNCHSVKDSISTIDINDMQNFTEKILYKILTIS